uniref:AB hydrolase-1 domain-containing protein n=1 Tax=Photinus pyralis TaxID=7054 RepID=A0A1Y1KX63_PHOPY
MQSGTFWHKCLIRTIIILASFLLTCLIILLGVPLAIQNSEKLQRYFVFPTHNLLPEEPEFSNFQKYNIYGGRNLMVSVGNDSAVQLGVWHLLPHALADEYIFFEQFDYDYALKHSKFPVVVYFHANGGNRIKFANMYHVLRKFFHVIAFDYRGYADSSEAIPEETGIVEDCVSLYKWLRARTNADVFFWGHSIGAALSTHAVVKLQREDLYVNGLVLEAPFTAIRDQLEFNPFYKVNGTEIY